MPVPVADIPLAVSEFSDEDTVWHEGSICNLIRDTDVPFRLHVTVDGGTAEDIALLRRFMPVLKDWSLDQNDGVVGIPHTLSMMMQGVRNPCVAVVPPHIWIDDKKWFGKMQVVQTKDPHNMMVSADVPNTLSSTAPPQKLDHKTHASSPLFLTNKNAIQNVIGASFLTNDDYWVDFSRRALGLGGTRWVASSVRYGDAHAGQEAGTLEPS